MIAKYAKQQVEKNEKVAREYGEKVRHNPTNAIAKRFHGSCYFFEFWKLLKLSKSIND